MLKVAANGWIDRLVPRRYLRRAQSSVTKTELRRRRTAADAVSFRAGVSAFPPARKDTALAACPHRSRHLLV